MCKSAKLNLLKKTVIILFFKLKALVIGNKFDLGGGISYCLFYKNLGLGQKNVHQQIDEAFDISGHLSLPPCRMEQIGNSHNLWMYTHRIKTKGLHRELKITHINFTISNNHVTVTY